MVLLYYVTIVLWYYCTMVLLYYGTIVLQGGPKKRWISEMSYTDSIFSCVHRLNVAFFGAVTLDVCFDTPGSCLWCIVGKLLWPECYEFGTKIRKKKYKHLCGLVDFLNQMPTVRGTLNRPIHKLFWRSSQDRHLYTTRNF